MRGNIGFDGKWVFQGCRIDGSVKWIEIVENIVLNEALDYALEACLEGATNYGDWYILLFESDSTPAATWVYANIGTDFTEFEDYDESTRVLWNSAGVTSQTDTNTANPAAFTCSTGISTTIYGAALVNVSTKGDNSSPAGIEWCATRFGTPRPFAAAEVINIVYTITSQDV